MTCCECQAASSEDGPICQGCAQRAIEERDEARQVALEAVDIALKFFRGHGQEHRDGYKAEGLVDRLKAIREECGYQE